MKLMVMLVKWENHIAAVLAFTEIEEAEGERALELEKARQVSDTWTGNSSSRVAISKAQATMNKEVQQLADDLALIHARRKLHGIMYDGLARDAGVVSREITRRVGREPHERLRERFGS